MMNRWKRLGRLSALVLLTAVATSCGTVVTTIFDRPPALPAVPAGENPTGIATEERPPGEPSGVPHERETEPGLSPGGVEVITLSTGSQSAIRVPVQAVISDRFAYLDAWAAVHAITSAPPSPPEVDFNTRIVVVLGLGDRPTAGYSVTVESATIRDGAVVVVVAVTSPEEGGLAAAVVTSPFTVASVLAAGLPVVFAGDDVTLGYDPDL